MSVSLNKGGSVSLTKEAGASRLTSITVGLGWDPREGFGADFDLDASAIILGKNAMALSDDDLVFYNALKSPTGAVTHTGDSRDGRLPGDDESLIVELDLVPEAGHAIVFIVSIHDARSRGQSFGVVDNAFIRVVNNADGRELARFDLSEGATSDTALTFGELYRDGVEWKFRAIGDGFPEGFAAALHSYGINVG
ncbi:chemical-damaging agent resistance protein C [Salinibacterium xinjiangense]|uniref:Tellurium resistance protein TerD n=1 Tax=Salinibacterium xinjiangense TaxID=386302 RepID=A0A2C8YTC7_9MICO|nr:TerD family protein [Salinibacterium xinjiangense]GGK99834.1 chemical-damaging agent resistance protein C [Salinibacterium xinjiangense]SOE53903.1 tellurium resistance protein TerD [Salinibacterium xinjiangense]